MPRTVTGREFARIVGAVTLGGVYVHDIYVEKHARFSGREANDLTERESEVLRQLALGNSMKEIAGSLRISAKTVDTYKNRANRKLNLRTRSDIVRYAIRSGWMN